MNKRINLQYNLHPFIYTLAGYATHPLQTHTGSNEKQKSDSLCASMEAGSLASRFF
jgi:hypothetical protein